MEPLVTLKVDRSYVVYDSAEQIVRYASANTIEGPQSNASHQILLWKCVALECNPLYNHRNRLQNCGLPTSEKSHGVIYEISVDVFVNFIQNHC